MAFHYCSDTDISDVATGAFTGSVAMGVDHGSKVKDCPAIVGSTDQLEEFSGLTTPTGFGFSRFKVIGSNIPLSHTHTSCEDVLMLEVTDLTGGI